MGGRKVEEGRKVGARGERMTHETKQQGTCICTMGGGRGADDIHVHDIMYTV